MNARCMLVDAPVHSETLRSRKAFMMTDTELKLIAAPAIQTWIPCYFVLGGLVTFYGRLPADTAIRTPAVDGNANYGCLIKDTTSSSSRLHDEMCQNLIRFPAWFRRSENSSAPSA